MVYFAFLLTVDILINIKWKILLAHQFSTQQDDAKPLLSGVFSTFRLVVTCNLVDDEGKRAFR
jgi:hypothetical protein